MAAEKNTFPFKGLEIEVSTGSETEQAYIKFEENGVVKEYYIDGFKTSKAAQEVIVNYKKFIKDVASNIYNQDVEQSFDATKQENAAYFYNLPADKLGLKIDVMSINGLLYELKGALCYSPENGNFYPPISADIEVENATYNMVEQEMPEKPELDQNNLPEFLTNLKSEPIRELNNNGVIKVFTVDIIGNPTFSILGTEISNTTGIFNDLAAGEYKIMIASDAAEMPAIITANVGLEEAEE